MSAIRILGIFQNDIRVDIQRSDKNQESCEAANLGESTRSKDTIWHDHPDKLDHKLYYITVQYHSFKI